MSADYPSDPSSADCRARLLAALEEGLPLDKRPFQALAGQLGLGEDEVVLAVGELVDRGVIRRLAVLFDSRKLGLATTLVGAVPAQGRGEETVRLINSLDEVTHHYRRGGSPYELWFTLTARSRGRIDEILETLRASGLVERLIEVPAEEVFKMRVRFSPPGNWRHNTPFRDGRETTKGHLPENSIMSPISERQAIAAVEDGLPVSTRPYRDAAERAGLDEETLIDALKTLAARGVLRRIGAILSPTALGLEAAALVAWRIEEEELARCGRELAADGRVTHCLSRKSHRDWPYNLYTMVHAADRGSLLAWAQSVSERLDAADYVVMETLEELKKSPTRYSRILGE